MEELLKELGFVVMFDDRFEADDIVGSVVSRFEKEIPSYIITKDHDYLQLINDYTRVWLVQTKQETADELQAKYDELKKRYDDVCVAHDQLLDEKKAVEKDLDEHKAEVSRLMERGLWARILNR
jgi:5'-3' exonuclease